MTTKRVSANRLVASRVKGFVCIVSILLLSACAHVEVEVEEPIEITPPEPVEPAGWQVLKKQRQSIKSWELRGRLGLQTEYNGGSLDFNWRQDGDDYVIRMIAPMGQGTFLISGDSQSATIRAPGGKSRFIENPDAMFKSTIGVDLPIAALRDWVRGVPASSLELDSREWDEQGMLHIIEQAGWHIEMSNNLGENVPLPHKIYINREDQPELDIRLVLRQWMIDN